MTLKEEIQEVSKEIAEMESWLDILRMRYKLLRDSRVDCEHEFSPALPGYEHEGGECKVCGINELYAHTLKQQKQKQI